MAAEPTRDVPNDVRTAYQVAASLYMEENSLTWNRFNAMLTANGVLLAAISFALPEPLPALLLALVLPCVGVALCITWRKMMDRGFLYSDTWRGRALHLERTYFRPEIDILEQGESLRDPPGESAPTRARQFARYVIQSFYVVYGATFAIAAGQVINLYVL
jgi:hypothetical protein